MPRRQPARRRECPRGSDAVSTPLCHPGSQGVSDQFHRGVIPPFTLKGKPGPPGAEVARGRLGSPVSEAGLLPGIICCHRLGIRHAVVLVVMIRRLLQPPVFPRQDQFTGLGRGGHAAGQNGEKEAGEDGRWFHFHNLSPNQGCVKYHDYHNYKRLIGSSVGMTDLEFYE